jgi:uncharacterized membrane-anchored protein
MDGPAQGEAPRFDVHPLRAAVLGEVHARPFQLIEPPRTVLHLAFLTASGGIAADRAMLAELATRLGLSGPGPDAKHVAIPMLGGTLRWEQHTEFSTWTFDVRWSARTLPPHPFGAGFRQPGPLMVATRLDLLPEPADLAAAVADFDPVSLCVVRVVDGTAIAATDFREDADGFTRYRLFDLALAPARAGATVQRLLEIETYRTFALLGLPEAQRLAPSVRRIEEGLASASAAMRDSKGLEEDSRLLDELTALAATLEADVAASAYRFGATRAYYGIVGDRIESVREERIAAYSSLSSFLQRRIGPAMRTCQAIEDRQSQLATKLGRTANLLRTRVDVEIEQQNRNLLRSMNLRARMQYRLQQTVEGLSIAAVSYYVVSLIAYLAKGAKEAGLPMPDPAVAAALSVVPVVLALWWVVRRIRRRHAAEDRGEGEH